MLDNKFKDVKNVTITENVCKDVISKPANVVMNDYTKNIS